MGRILVGGTRSGEGKTTVALGLMAALRRRGLETRGFKVGPDYLDTGYQELATGHPGRNLDLWMMGAAAVEASLAAAADATAVIEGVMGLFDGHRRGDVESSSADVARITRTPVVLVLDAGKMAASVGAIALGFKNFDPRVEVAGVILNRWRPGRCRLAAERALAIAGVPPLGYLPNVPEAALPSRHLGLVVANEIGGEAAKALAAAAAAVEANVDLDRVLEIAAGAPALPSAPPPPGAADSAAVKARIGVARDEAFAFYYPDNLEILAAAGAELVFFSPLRDASPPAVDGLYFGGGYPEIHAAALSANRGMRAALAAAIAAGMPVYAECGGMLYLCENLEDMACRPWPMVGAVPRRARMGGAARRVGYRDGTLRADCPLGAAGAAVRGHVFHYSTCEPPPSPVDAAYLMEDGPEGYCHGRLFASYLHLHFAGCPEVAARFVGACRGHRLVGQ